MNTNVYIDMKINLCKWKIRKYKIDEYEGRNDLKKIWWVGKKSKQKNDVKSKFNTWIYFNGLEKLNIRR